MFFFLFKQKTAYEMRISDWSSDVCSSDLLRGAPLRRGPPARAGLLQLRDGPVTLRYSRPWQRLADSSHGLGQCHTADSGHPAARVGGPRRPARSGPALASPAPTKMEPLHLLLVPLRLSLWQRPRRTLRREPCTAWEDDRGHPQLSSNWTQAPQRPGSDRKST